MRSSELRGSLTALRAALSLTEKGMREKDRLVTLAGLMVEKNNMKIN